MTGSRDLHHVGPSASGSNPGDTRLNSGRPEGEEKSVCKSASDTHREDSEGMDETKSVAFVRITRHNVLCMRVAIKAKWHFHLLGNFN